MNSYTENTFSIIDINSLDELDDNLIKKPDILLIDTNEELTEDIIKYTNDNFIRIIRVVDSFSVKDNDNNDITFSFALKKYEGKDKLNSDTKIQTEFDYSIEVLKKIAQLNNTLKLKQLSKELFDNCIDREESLSILLKLNSFLDLKDSSIKIHCENVSKYAVLLAEELNLSSNQIEIIKIGSKLHDIGKIGIPDSILMKKTFLSKQEFEIMKRHTLIGDILIPDNDEYKLIKQMIRSHHERMDGNGYPDGLKDTKIPIFARILSIADSFDAMTTNRIYNNPKTFIEAIEELRKVSTPIFDSHKNLIQQLDPILVEKFIEGISKNKELIDEFIEKDLETINLRKSKRSK